MHGIYIPYAWQIYIYTYHIYAICMAYRIGAGPVSFPCINAGRGKPSWGVGSQKSAHVPAAGTDSMARLVAPQTD